jgi:hypothetical protein
MRIGEMAFARNRFPAAFFHAAKCSGRCPQRGKLLSPLAPIERKRIDRRSAARFQQPVY